MESFDEPTKGPVALSKCTPNLDYQGESEYDIKQYSLEFNQQELLTHDHNLPLKRGPKTPPGCIPYFK